MSDPESSSNALLFGPAISLSYDGADPSHLETALPCLAERELKATFYVTETGLLDSIAAWTVAQNEGHEIGCHSLFEAADALGNLPKWTLENVEADLREARKLLTETFPHQSDFSFAYPGVETMCMTVPYDPSPTSYAPVVERLFTVARSARDGVIDPAHCDVMNLESIDARDLTLDDLIVAAEHVMFENRWAIFAFRGIGAGEGAVDASSHTALCDWLAEHRGVVRTGTVFEIANEVRSRFSANTYSWSLGSSES
ncbi:MAG TPA: polysaccharide deacetylase family protein [Fimbriimonadaceae bacterium]|nr:polysaccharide deacetylase family protein [Fimbriimonadaceae bacterium]